MCGTDRAGLDLGATVVRSKIRFRSCYKMEFRVRGGEHLSTYEGENRRIDGMRWCARP